jgi:exodeoxyribonuclease VII small subunit
LIHINTQVLRSNGLEQMCRASVVPDRPPAPADAREPTWPGWFSETAVARKSHAPAAPASGEMSYEDALAELERMLASMEGGQLPLDRLMQTYERGAELLQLCRSRLDAVEQQVKVLEEGQLKPWAAS